MKATHKTLFISIAFVMAFAISSMSCAKPPTDEMNKAIEAVTRAENDRDAVTYAANTITRAKDSLARMHVEADSKRYDSAKTYAEEAIANAERAISEGRFGAERARNEAAVIISQLPAMFEETEQGINAAQAAGLPLDFESLASEVDTALYNANEADAAFAERQYQEATNRGQSARAVLSNINRELSTAAMAVSRKK